MNYDETWELIEKLNSEGYSIPGYATLQEKEIIDYAQIWGELVDEEDESFDEEKWLEVRRFSIGVMDSLNLRKLSGEAGITPNVKIEKAILLLIAQMTRFAMRPVFSESQEAAAEEVRDNLWRFFDKKIFQ